VPRVSIPSNGSSLFQFNVESYIRKDIDFDMSQSPQTGQVYFNPNEFKDLIVSYTKEGLNPLKRVKFISIDTVPRCWATQGWAFVSIPSNGSSLFQFQNLVHLLELKFG